MSILGELWIFLRARKRVWLFPVILLMVLLGVLFAIAGGSVVGPFIYTLF